VSKKNKQLDEEGVVPPQEETPADVAAGGASGGPAAEEALTAARQEAEQNRDLYLRARADLDNFRKRAQRDKEDLARFANENILREILPVLDNLERAVEHADKEGGSDGSLFEGVKMTVGMFGRVLEKFGVTPVAALGEAFDPSRHEAMGQIESADHPPNTVVQDLQKGYMLNDRLLRPAMVMVSKAPVAPPAAEAAEND